MYTNCAHCLCKAGGGGGAVVAGGGGMVGSGFERGGKVVWVEGEVYRCIVLTEMFPMGSWQGTSSIGHRKIDANQPKHRN